MSKRSGIGKGSDDFKFNKSQPGKIPKLPQLRPSDRTSFYIRPDTTLYPKDPCDGMHINQIPNLLSKKGRQFGEIVDYDVVQEKNYLSISDRYERSLDLIPLSIQKRGNAVVYLFCSSGSPTGYWEVEVTSGATYLRFTEPLLTIICPRPFQLSTLTQVETDATFITWSQLQGRTTIVFPETGDGSLDPYISIIGSRTPRDPPIFLLAEGEGDPTVFDILAINTTIKDVLGDASLGSGEQFAPCKSVPCSLRFQPPLSNTSVVWENGEAMVAWYPPRCESAWVEEYRVQQNVTGEYTDIFNFPTPQFFPIFKNSYYRILTVFNVLGRGKEISTSCTFYIPETYCPIKASDRVSNAAISSGEFTVTQYAVNSQLLEMQDIVSHPSISSGDFIVTQYAVASTVLDVSDEKINASIGSGDFIVTQYNLEGLIIG